MTDSLRDLVAQWRKSARKWKRCPEGGHDDMAHATSQGVALGKITCAAELEARLNALSASDTQQAQEVCMCVDGAICGCCKKPFRIAQQAQPLTREQIEALKQSMSSWDLMDYGDEERIRRESWNAALDKVAALYDAAPRVAKDDCDVDGCPVDGHKASCRNSRRPAQEKDHE